HDHRSLALLFFFAQPVLKQLALEQAAAEVSLESRMTHRQQLRRDQAAQFGAAFDVVGFGHPALHRFAPECASILLETAAQPRQFAELAIACEMAPQFQALTRGESAALAKLEAEVVTVLSDAIDFLCEPDTLCLHAPQLGLIGMADLFGHLARL